MPVPSLPRVGVTTDNGDHARNRRRVRGSGRPIAGAGDPNVIDLLSFARAPNDGE